MKIMVVLFLLLSFLLSACGAPDANQPMEVQQTLALPPTPIFQTQPLSQAAFCQGEPEYIRLGSSTKLSVFSLPANQPVAFYLDSQLLATSTTEPDGRASIDVMIPMDEMIGLHQVSVYATGTNIIVTCQIKFWSDLIPSPTYSFPSTSTPAPTLSPEHLTMTATLQTLQERMGKFCYHGSALRARLSPNGQWIEVNCASDDIKIVRIDESEVWDVSSNRLIGLYSYHFVYVNHWSNDGVYVYVFVNPHTDGYWESFHQGIVLFRLHLETGQISEVLPLREGDWMFYSFAFSPNDRRLAYIVTDKSPVVLKIRDMQTGDEQSFEFDSKYNTGGGFVWSPDSQKLVFSIMQFDTSIYEHIGTSIILWDKEKPETTVLIQDHEQDLMPIEWLNDTKIILQIQYDNDTKFEFDLTSGELKQTGP